MDWDDMSLEQKVMSYLRYYSGTWTKAGLAKRLHTTPKEIKRALEKLGIDL